MNEYLGVQAVEEHLYLRFPVDLAESIREDLRDVKKPSDLSIVFTGQRTAVVHVGADEHLPAVLVDLPTVTETLKSLDPGSGPSTTGQYCKVADASQMLIVLANEEQAKQFERQMKQNDFQFSDGLAPPMHQARQRRFRPESGRRRRAEIEAIEEQVKRLMERDETSEQSSFEYFVNGRLVRSSSSSDKMASSSAASTTPHHRATDDLDAELAAEIEGELMAQDEAEEGGEGEEGEGEEEEEAMEDMPMVDETSERLKELEVKRLQLERVTNPAIRAFLEETIKQLESELQP